MSDIEIALSALLLERNRITNLVEYNTEKAFEILPNLFLSNFTCTRSDIIGKIELLVNCTKDLPFPSATKNRQDIRLAIDDDCSQDAFDTFVEKVPAIIETMREYIGGGKKVLVHCRAGQQRSCALIAAYLMKTLGNSVEEAINHVKSVKPDAFFYYVNFAPALERLQKRNK